MRTQRRCSVRLLALSATGALCFTFVLVGIASAAAFNTWTKQTSGTTQALRGAAFVNAATGWAVGAGGTVRHTTDGGATWTKQTSGTTQTLYGVAFIDASNGWAVGGAGTIRHTDNGGATWKAQTSGTTKTLYGVAFVDASNGWAVGAGGTIRHTTDGGATWTAQTSGTTLALNATAFVDASNGWVVGAAPNKGSATIRHTTDGGTTWTAQISGAARKQTLYGVTFIDASNGWAVGTKGVVRHTTNGGASWTGQTAGTTQTLNAVAFATADDGWAVGAGGTIRRTTDGGSTWAGETSGTTVTLRGLARASGGLWATGDAGTILSYLPDLKAPTTTAAGLQADDHSGWRNSDASVGLTAGDGKGSGVAATYYTVDGGPQQTYAGAFTVSGTGQHQVHYWSVDRAGNEEVAHSGWVNIDTIVPTVGDDADAAWHRSDVTVHLSPTDGGGSGVAVTQYRLQGATTWLTATGDAFTVPAPAGGANDGPRVYEYQALDNAGNVSVAESCAVLIDTTPATSVADGLAPDPLTGWTATSRTVTLLADDGSGAGVATIRYTVDDGPQQVYAGAFTVSGAGQHQVDYWSLDKAGNVEATRSGWVNIADFYAEASGLAPDAESGWRNTDASVTITPGGGPGPLTVAYQVDGGGWQTVDAASFTVSGVGHHTIAYYATNGVGQDSAQLTGYVNIETTAPVTTRSSAPGAWRRTALTVTLAASDGDSGVASTSYSIDGGPATEGTSITIPAPKDHTWDGVHRVTYHSVDKAGNVEATKTFTVRIDTRRPSTRAPYPAGVTRYAVAKLRCKALDSRPSAVYASAKIVVKRPNGRVVFAKSYPRVRTNVLVALKFRCKLAPGAYRFLVLAKDAAGNTQYRTGYNRLIVR